MVREREREGEEMVRNERRKKRGQIDRKKREGISGREVS